MKLDVEALRQHDADALASLRAAALRSARLAAFSTGANNYEDDIAQEIVIHVLTRFLDVYDPALDVDNYFHEMARRLGRSMHRASTRELHRGDALDLADAAGFEDGDAAIEDIEREAVEQAAIDARRILAGRIRARAHRNAKKTDARGDMDTQALPESPRRPAVRASPLLAADGAPLIWTKLREWCAVLGIDTSVSGWHNTLAERLGAHRATVWRWRNGKTQPSASVVRGLDALVADMTAKQTRDTRT